MSMLSGSSSNGGRSWSARSVRIVSTAVELDAARVELSKARISSLGPAGKMSMALRGVNLRIGFAVMADNYCALSTLSTSAPIVGFQMSRVKAVRCDVTTLPRMV